MWTQLLHCISEILVTPDYTQGCQWNEKCSFSTLPHLHHQKTISLKFYELLQKFFRENHDNYCCFCRVTNLLHRFQSKDTSLKNSFLFSVKPECNFLGRQGFLGGELDTKDTASTLVDFHCSCCEECRGVTLLRI